LRLLLFMGFSRSNTVVTLYARPLRPLLFDIDELMALESARAILRVIRRTLGVAE